MSLYDSESRSSSESRLNVRPRTATFFPLSVPRRRLTPCTTKSGTDSFTRDTARSMPGALERSSEKAKSFRRHVPAVNPGSAIPPRG